MDVLATFLFLRLGTLFYSLINVGWLGLLYGIMLAPFQAKKERNWKKKPRNKEIEKKLQGFVLSSGTSTEIIGQWVIKLTV